MMTKLLGIQIAHGLTSETRVFASLLAERDDRYESRVLMHDEGGAADDVARFAALAKSEISRIDTGWRPNRSGHRLSPSRASVAVRYLSRIDSSIAFAADYHPDVVYSSQQHYDCRTATRVARSLGVPQIIHLHYIIGPWLRRVVIDRLRTTDHVVAVSDFVRQQVTEHGVPADRVTTIRNTMRPFPPVDPETRAAIRSAQRIPADAFVFGMVSRLDASKGHVDAVAAFERVATSAPNAVLAIAGTGRQDAAIRRRAARSAVADRIRFLGQRADVPAVLGSFDAFVHPATADPCPLAVLEAMASRLPVVAYADGGVPELIETGVSGQLAPLGDVDALATMMATVLQDAELAKRLGETAGERIAVDFAPARAGVAFADLVTSMG